MLEETKDALVNAAQNIEIEISPQNHYSGRGMYGKETYAVVIDSLSHLLPCVFVAGHMNNGDESILEDLRKLRWDNMARRIVVY